MVMTVIDLHGIELKLLLFLFFIFTYAEIHFRIPFIRGFIYREQPEIIFDTPYRIQADQLPILLLAKDADRFPVYLKEIYIEISDGDSAKLLLSRNITENLEISTRWFSKIYWLDVSAFRGKTLEVACRGFFSINGKTFIIRNDNYPGLSHKNLRVFIDSEPLPKEKGWISGDLHCHSYYTEDQVEFGLPVHLFSELGPSMGLSFSAITDHSYDLDDKPGSWVKFDQKLTKYKKSREEIEAINKKSKNYILIPGEELTVDNGKGRHVHMLILNNKYFIPGNADGFEGIFNHKVAKYYAEISELADDSMLTASAHPLTEFPLVQQIVLKRGVWNFNDKTDKLDGHQILNGKIDEAFKKGKKLWVKQLLDGQKKFIYAGNDSHGNLNRFRQLRTPLLKLYERDYQIFGECRTMVKFDISRGMENLVKTLKSRDVIITNGPFVNITAKTKTGEIKGIGSHINHKNLLSIKVTGKSSNFFGNIKKLTLLHGKVRESEEHKILDEDISQKVTNIESEIEPTCLSTGYVRAEIYTDKNKFALSNPIWLI